MRLHESAAERMAATGAHDRSENAVGMPSVGFVKVHDAYTLTLKGEPLLGGERAADGAIVIVRDPRDVAPSLANHNSTTIDAAIAFMADRASAFCANTTRQPSQLRQKLLGWNGHVPSWLDQSDLPIHLIRYEDMQADTAGTLSRAMAFAQYDVDAGQIERAVKQASFTELQAQESANGFREAPRPASGGRFFRRGIAGAWRDELTPAQIARLEADHAAMMLRLGYELVSAATPIHAE